MSVVVKTPCSARLLSHWVETQHLEKHNLDEYEDDAIAQNKPNLTVQTWRYQDLMRMWREAERQNPYFGVEQTMFNLQEQI